MIRKLKDNIKYESVDEYLKTFILLCDALYFKSKITPKEIEYLIAILKIEREGVNITSQQANKILRRVFNTKDRSRSVHIYRKFLKDKKWLIQTIDNIVLHPLLKGAFTKIDLNIMMKYEPGSED